MADSTLKELIDAIARSGEGMAASVAAIAVRCTSTWEVIAGRVVILPAELASELSPRLFVDLPGLVAWSAVIPADGLLAWLQKLESGSSCATFPFPSGSYPRSGG